ncbi:hypothetical protein AA313_de0210310 [Arthrobotrys entomopaga]|nr:hypothetical protein AA313_de0210310 [Arthrobotrys entomopaga]
MPIFDQKDFKSRFPLGFGEPITKLRCPTIQGPVIIHQGGPVDLEDPEITAENVNTRLGIHPLEHITKAEATARAKQANIEGIIYDSDKTYRYFVWLVLERRYFVGLPNGVTKAVKHHKSDAMISGLGEGSGTSVVNGDGGDTSSTPSTIVIKNEDGEGSESDDGKNEDGMAVRRVKAADYFFDANENEQCNQFPLLVDGESFTFHAPDDHSDFYHYNILGQDFLESRFKKVDADYVNSKVHIVRRKKIYIARSEHSPTPEWVRERDEDLERYLDEDDEDDSGEDADDEGGSGSNNDEKRGRGRGRGRGMRRVWGDEEKIMESVIDPRLLVLDDDDEPKEVPMQQVRRRKREPELEDLVKVDKEGDVAMTNSGDVNVRIVKQNSKRMQDSKMIKRKEKNRGGIAEYQGYVSSPGRISTQRQEKRTGLVSKENLKISRR